MDGVLMAKVVNTFAFIMMLRFYIDRSIDGHPIRAREETNDSVLSKKEILSALNYLDGRVSALSNALQETRDGGVKQPWLPLSTAPKDGTRFIMASLGNSNRFDSETKKLIDDPTLRVLWVSPGRWSDKWDKFWDGWEPTGFANATHWMPMPEAI